MRPTVVVVDDNEDLRYLIQIRVSDFHVVAEAPTYREAVPVVREIQPDVIISHLGMPLPGAERHWFEMLRLYREAAPDAKVVLFSVFHPGEVVESLRPDAFVLNNGNLDTLITTLHDLVR